MNRIRLFDRALLVLLAALVGVTWRIWAPTGDFPQVPLFRILCDCPPWVDWLLLGLGGVCWGTALVRDRELRLGQAARLGLVAVLVALILLNQHRAQAWTWHAILMLLLLGTLPDDQFLRWARALVISIYLYSAASKVSAEFLHGFGQAFLHVMLRTVNLRMSALSPALQQLLPCAFPAGELAVGLALCFPVVLRRAGLAAAVGMHLLLLWLLGPWGLDHSWGVLLWNVLFLVQAVCLFTREPQLVLASTPAFPVWGSRVARAVVAWALIWPLGYRLGGCDPWQAWAVYLPEAESVTIAAPVDYTALSNDLRFLKVRRPVGVEMGLWVELDVGRESLVITQTPVHPTTRFKCGVVLRIADLLEMTDSDLNVAIYRNSARFSGRVGERRLTTRAELERLADSYWFNAYPRNLPTP